MKYTFDADTNKIFQLMIHSIYKNKEIFLRELISNASDALDKRRFLQQGETLDSKIEISVDGNKLTIRDTGVGMDETDLRNNLGTIARSGTEEFIKSASDNTSLIGQFGVGFYSCFMVASQVEVLTRKYNSDTAFKWSSTGDSSYEIEEAESEVGTAITLTINDEDKEYLDEHRLDHIISTYSQHIGFPIFFAEKQINSGKAVWLKSKTEATQEELNNFYSQVSTVGGGEPLYTIHYHAEGAVEYKMLLFVPHQKPFDLFHPDRMTRTKLYIKRVFISESEVNLIPSYMRFLRGVIDSDDLPLNVSRETVQNSGNLAKIKASITKKILKDFAAFYKQDAEKYRGFWNDFGAVIKEGLCEAMEPRSDIFACSLFNTLLSDAPITLAEYKAKMQDGQKEILYIIGDDLELLKKAPQLEKHKTDGTDVVLLVDNVDQFWLTGVFDFDGTPLLSLTKTDNTAGEKDVFTDFVKEILGDRISDVKYTDKLVDSSCCLSSKAWGMDIRMERFMLENHQLSKATSKILEVNKNHELVQNITTKLTSSNSDGLADIVNILYLQAALNEGEKILDLSSVQNSLNNLLSKVA
jgi:molecular chaperone HtpG